MVDDFYNGAGNGGDGGDGGDGPNDYLTLMIRDQVGRFWTIRDDQGGKIKNGLYGYESADWVLDREFGFSWDDIGLNNQVFYFTPFGDEVFHGRLDVVAPTLSDGIGSLANQANGYKDSGTDITWAGGSLTGTPEAKIAALITGSAFLQLTTDTTGLVTTGIASDTTSTPNSGTDDITAWDFVLQICRSGTSAGYKVVPQVWGDRRLVTKAINTVNPTPRYIVDVANVRRTSLKRTLSEIYTQISVRYKDSADGSLKHLYLPATPSATTQALGVDYTGGGIITDYWHRHVVDITSLYPDGCTAAQATNVATALLNEEQRVRNTTDALVIDVDYVIFDVLEGQEIPLCQFRGDDWLQINGFSPWPTDVGTGTSAGDQATTSLFLVTGAEYDITNHTLTITPESAGDLASAIMEKIQG